MKIFGIKETFAIEYRPDTISEKYAFAFCHLFLGGQRIGNEEESCMLSSWFYYFKRQLLRIQLNEGRLRSPLFEGLSDREIFNLIYEEYYNTVYSFDKQAVDDLFHKHVIRIDETIDGYNLAVIEEEDHLKFLWVSRGGYESAEEIEKLYTISLPHKEFYQAAEECLSFLKEQYPKHLKE